MKVRNCESISVTTPVRGGFVVLLSVLFCALALPGFSQQCNVSDGKIVFLNSDKINIMNSDGSGLRPVDTSSASPIVREPMWSPDGRKISFLDEGNDLYVMDGLGSNITLGQNITVLATSACSRTTWSPDGTKIGYGDCNGIATQSLSDSSIAQLTSNSGDIEPIWSPDGTKIAFDSDRDTGGNGHQIYVMNSDGTQITRLTNANSDDTEPWWSADGKKIAFTRIDYDNNFYVSIQIVNSDGTNESTYITSAGYDRTPTFSGEGRWVAFVSQRDGLANANVYVIDYSLGTTTNLTNSEYIHGGASPSFSNDITPPQLTISYPPSNGPTLTTASFTAMGYTFDCGSGVASVQVQLDSGSFVSPTGTTNWSYPLTGLAQGAHTLTVTSTDNRGNTSLSISKFKIDSIPPDTAISSAKDKLGKAIMNNSRTSSTSTQFVFNGTDNFGVAGFQCKLDTNAFSACSSPVNYAVLTKGTHIFEVEAIDTAGNIDPTPATFTWTVTTNATK